jgi:hypothetical protein
MDSREFQDKCSEMASLATLTFGSEGQQTKSQLASYARNAVRHLDYINPKDSNTPSITQGIHEYVLDDSKATKALQW